MTKNSISKKSNKYWNLNFGIWSLIVGYIPDLSLINPKNSGFCPFYLILCVISIKFET